MTDFTCDPARDFTRDYTPDLATAIEAEHGQLKRIMDQLLANVDASFTAAELTSWRNRYLRSLRVFRRTLLLHFKLEEEGGFFSTVIRLAPHHINRVRMLEAEHSQIIAALDLLITFVETPPASPGAVLPAIRKRLNRLVERIRAHESAECALIQEAYYQDFGVGD